MPFWKICSAYTLHRWNTVWEQRISKQSNITKSYNHTPSSNVPLKTFYNTFLLLSRYAHGIRCLYTNFDREYKVELGQDLKRCLKTAALQYGNESGRPAIKFLWPSLQFLRHSSRIFCKNNPAAFENTWYFFHTISRWTSICDCSGRKQSVLLSAEVSISLSRVNA